MMDELITAVEAMDPAVLGNALLATTAIVAAIAAFGLVRYLMTAIGYSRMYRKAGEAGWKAFIPFYNTYNNYKISWNSEKFFQYAVLCVLFIAMCHSTMLSLKLAGILACIILTLITMLRWQSASARAPATASR